MTGPVLDIIDDGGSGWGESTCEQAAQTDSSSGCIFYPLMLESDNSSLPFAVAVGNTNLDETEVVLYANDGTEIESAMVPGFGLHTFVIDPATPAYDAHDLPLATGISARALRIEAQAPVVAYQFAPYSASQQATSDASMLIPHHAWGSDYLMAAWAGPGSAGVAIVASQDDTEVTITIPLTFESTTEAGGGVPALAAGESTTHTLAAGEVLQVHHPLSISGHDFSGARVTATNPVATFFTAPLMTVPGQDEFADHLETQMPPMTAWGDSYSAVHFQPRGNGTIEDDVFRFLADTDGTVIDLTGDVTQTLNLDAGEFADVLTAGSFTAGANHEFLAAHFMVSTSLTPGVKDDDIFPGDFLSPNCDNLDPTDNYTHVGDPAMTWLIPTDQFRSRYVFAVPETYAWDFVTVTGPMAAMGDISLDESPLDGTPQLVPGSTEQAFVRVPVGDGTHVIESSSETGFGISVYGYDCRVSYAYPGGTSLVNLNPPG
jgi:hypothetical protein